ncbi:inovirus Gp2 family protein [Citrobacter farmeri]|uniref:inovirus Gp2 family protein n=1 Tax=Citrobacter farmeri TaxID=67824 RepID=UPI000F676D6D|nr:inovirus Gp2 family protein [Citrobacter farmeri]RSB14994.1 inovirus Gp2 family protein [Citrobacter farmeri]
MHCNITGLVQKTIQYKYIKSHGPLNKYQLKRIEQTIDKALDEYPRVMAIRVELHMPVCRPLCDMLLADDYARTDAAAISRFNASLNAKIKHYELKQKKAGKRVRETSSRIVWAREFCPTNNKKHYHVLLLLNRDAFNSLGSFEGNKGTLLRIIREAWMSAIGLIYPKDKELVKIPENPCYYVNVKDGKLSEAYRKLIFRSSYLAKEKSKCFTDGERNFGCSIK